MSITHVEASHLLIAIKKNMDDGFKLSPKDQSIIANILSRMQHRASLSDRQAWALQEIYRRSTGHGKKLWSRVV